MTSYTPIGQESVLAYEAGVKAGFFAGRLQLNASAFYYDYRDKQLRSARLDPPFGPLEALASIPKSHVIGTDVQLVAKPAHGLTLDAAVTYTHTRIDEFVGFDSLTKGDQAGTPFPLCAELAIGDEPGLRGAPGPRPSRLRRRIRDVS